MDNFNLRDYLYNNPLLEWNPFKKKHDPSTMNQGRGWPIQTSTKKTGNIDRFFSNDHIANLENDEGVKVEISKHPEDGDYFAYIHWPYDEEKLYSEHYEVYVPTLKDVEQELIKWEVLKPNEDINDLKVIEGSLS